MPLGVSSYFLVESGSLLRRPHASLSPPTGVQCVLWLWSPTGLAEQINNSLDQTLLVVSRKSLYFG